MKNQSGIARYRFLQNGYAYLQRPLPRTLIRELEEIELARRYRKAGQVLFTRCFEEETGFKIPKKFNQKHIIENVFYGSLSKLNRLAAGREYYQCNAQLFIKYMDEVCLQISKGEVLQRRITRDFFFESIYLLQEHSWFRKTPPTEYGVGKSPQSFPFNIFKNSGRLSWFGQSDEINLGAATLRLAIEGRIRAAFGIYGVYNSNNKQTMPVNMSDIFDQMKLRENDIKISVPIDTLSLIYSWSNNYIHALYRTYPWLILFAHEVISPLFGSGTHGTKRGMTFTIVAPMNVIEEIRNVANYVTNSPEDWVINGADIEHCSIGIA